LLFFTEPTQNSVTVVIPANMTRIAITVSALVTVVLGVYPSIVLNPAQTFANFLK
jgi:NADH-quinone oxidoreductase subunit N